MGKKIFILIDEEAKKNRGRYNVAQDKERKLLHHDTCKAVKAYAEKSGFPIGILLYIGVSKEAHKESAFNKGYKGFDEKKAERVIKMCKAFAERFKGSERMAHSDRLVHAICRYDDMFNRRDKMSFFKDCLAQHPSKKISLSIFPTAKEVAHFIFGDKVQYNDNGYIMP